MDIDSKVKEMFGNTPAEDIKHAFSNALNIIMLVEFMLALGVFMFLKAFVSQLWADVWIIVCFALALKSSIDLVQPQVVKNVLETLGKSEEASSEKQKDTATREEEHSSN